MNVLEELTQQGITVRAKGEKLALSAPKGVITPEVVCKVAKHKAEVMAMLTSGRTLLRPPSPAIPPPPANPRAEAEEISRRVTEHGICLIWAETVKDFLAFVRDDFDRSKVPPGFVIYTDSELRELFGEGKQPSNATLRLIHEAKKQGGRVIPNPGPDTSGLRGDYE